MSASDIRNALTTSEGPARARARAAQLGTLEGHTRAVTGLAVLPSTGHLISVGLDGQVILWAYASFTKIIAMSHRDELRCLAVRPDTNEVLVGTAGGDLLVFPLPASVAPKKLDMPAVA